MALIWVKATELGFDGMQRRRVGVKFQTEEKKFSAKWMKKINAPRDEDEDVAEDKPTAKAGRASDKSPI